MSSYSILFASGARDVDSTPEPSHQPLSQWAV